MRLENKVAIISGGSRGMGAFEAELFVQEGAKVVVGDVRDDEGRALVEKIGAGAIYVHLDVTSEGRRWLHYKHIISAWSGGHGRKQSTISVI